MGVGSILRKSLSEIASGLRDGSFSAMDLAEEAIDNHEHAGESFNAYMTWDAVVPRRMAAAADAAFAARSDLGPLQGIPISIKDLYGVSGFPTYAGSGKRLPEIWEREGPVVKGIRAQLGVITGKTHTVEFAAGGLGTNIHWGAPTNPWDTERARSPGGSSSGAGASLWEGSCVAAFGSDTMGSVRIPATMMGLVGLKISAHRWSNAGIVPLRANQDTPGPLARTVGDAAYVFAALDPEIGDNRTSFLNGLERADMSNFTIGVADQCFWEDCDPGIVEAVRRALDELESAGARIVDAPSPKTAELLDVAMSGGFSNAELLGFLENELPGWIDQVDPDLKARLEVARTFSAAEQITRQRWVESLVGPAKEEFAGIDVIAAPTSCVTPQIIDEAAGTRNEKPIMSARNTCAANFLVQCAITLPAGFDEASMPVGLQLTAPGGSEEHLLRVASAAERVLGTGAERLGTPPMIA